MVLLVAVSCLFLGMGVPTTPDYIIASAIGAPLIAELGTAPLLSIHLFVLYFAVMADATPPVAAASYASAAIARANPISTGFHAFKIAAGGFIVGMAYVYEPALTLHGTPFEIVTATLAAASGIMLITIAYAGYTDGPLPIILRAVMIPAGLAAALYQGVPDVYRAVLGLGFVLAVIVGGKWCFASRTAAQDDVNSKVQENQA